MTFSFTLCDLRTDRTSDWTSSELLLSQTVSLWHTNHWCRSDWDQSADWAPPTSPSLQEALKDPQMCEESSRIHGTFLETPTPSQRPLDHPNTNSTETPSSGTSSRTPRFFKDHGTFYQEPLTASVEHPHGVWYQVLIPGPLEPDNWRGGEETRRGEEGRRKGGEEGRGEETRRGEERRRGGEEGRRRGGEEGRRSSEVCQQD